MNGSKMPTRIKVAIENAKEVLLSTITSWEIAVNLKWDHKDPADRWIVATAISEGATLVTLDRKILAFKKVKALSLKKDK